MIGAKIFLTIFITVAFVIAWKLEPLIIKQPHNKVDYILAGSGYTVLTLLLWIFF